MKDVQNIADILVDPTGEKETRDHWQTTAHALSGGAILHVLYAEKDKSSPASPPSLGPGVPQRQTLARMLLTPHLPHRAASRRPQAARGWLNKSDNELSGVFSTALGVPPGLYRDPIIGRGTPLNSDCLIADPDERRRARVPPTSSCPRATSRAPGPSFA